MPIVTSTHTVGHAQADGRRYVTETHDDGAGGIHVVEYLAAIGTDYVAVRDARAAVIADQLAEAEAQALADDGV